MVRRILAAAQRTPSWCNAQPWKVIVTRGHATARFREAMMAHARENPSSPDIDFPSAYEGVYRDRQRECGLQLYDAVGVPRGDRAASALQAAENFRLFGAPHVAIITTEAALGPYGLLDCGAYVSAFMLAAAAAGIGSIAQAALAAHSGLIRGHFSIPTERQVVCGISFGFEDEAHPANTFRVGRAVEDEVVSWRE